MRYDLMRTASHPSVRDRDRGQLRLRTSQERPELRAALVNSYHAALGDIGSSLNYGTAAEGAHMRGHPSFLNAMAEFLTERYGRTVDPQTLMSTSGSSIATDMVARLFCAPGDVAVSEAPTYYLAHQMFRESHLELREVPIEEDGMDVEALDRARPLQLELPPRPRLPRVGAADAAAAVDADG